MGNLISNQMEPILLTKQYKDHTIENVVEYLDEDLLPLNAKSVHLQPIRNLTVTIQILDEQTKEVIETITGLAKTGSIRMDASSLIRRTASLTLKVSDDTFPQSGSLIWFNRIAKIYVGIQDLTEVNTHINFLLGTFWIDEVGYSIDVNDSEISIDIKDKMTKWDGEKLANPLKLSPGTKVNEAIRLMMENIGETDFGFMEESLDIETIPYTKEYGIGEDIMTVITDLRDLYMDYVCGYNVRGEFEFKKIKNQKEDEIAEPKWSFDSQKNDRADLTLSFKETYSLKDIKNKVVVYGGTSDTTGLTPVGETRITDAKSPFNVFSIGERTQIIVEDKYTTNDQCISKARYEVWKSSNFQESCDISTVPLYLLDAFDIIEVVHPYTKESQKYIIDSFDLNLDPGSSMNISAHKLYYVNVEYGADKNPLVDAVIRGINNWGWLSLGEERIKECYNISGSGTATLTVRFQDVIAGGEQASVIAYTTTKNQTLMIDLADLVDLDVKNENGYSPGRSKGDYLDRVLAHEMFHAVSNDYLGATATNIIPVWFKEGCGEFLHGAKERFLSAYYGETNQSKREKLTALTKTVLEDNWAGTSEDYVAAYLIMIAIYRKCDKNRWSNLFIRLRDQPNLSINFLLKLLPIASTNDEIKTILLNEISSMDTVWNFLFNTSDLDTGSVGGIHFMNLYGVPLTAESVINNANATSTSIGFQVNIQK